MGPGTGRASVTRRMNSPDLDVTLILRCCDDEERIGHVLQRLGAHLRSLGLRFEVLLADEGSTDNTLAVAALVRAPLPELEVLHCPAGRGYSHAAERARGLAVVLSDARSHAPLSALGFALDRVRAGLDVVAASGRFLVFRRTRAWRALDALTERRDPEAVERRFLRRVRALGLSCASTPLPAPPLWSRLCDTVLGPLQFARL